jgi:hypothetical protein
VFPPPPEKVDPISGDRWRKVYRLYEHPAFTTVALLGCLLLAFGLWWLLAHGQQAPIFSADGLRHWQLAQSVAVGQGFSLPAGNPPQWWPQAHVYPVWPLLLAGLMLLAGSTDALTVWPLVQVVQCLLLLGLVVTAHQLTNLFFKPPYPSLVALLVTLTPLAWWAMAEGTRGLLLLALTLVSLVALEQAYGKAAEGKPPKQSALINSGLWVLLTVGTHPAGWTLVVLYLALALRWRGLRTGMTIAWLALAVLSPWLIRGVYLTGLYAPLHPGYTQAPEAPVGQGLTPDEATHWREYPPTTWKGLRYRVQTLGRGAAETLLALPLANPDVNKSTLHPSAPLPWLDRVVEGWQRLIHQAKPLHWLAFCFTVWGTVLLAFRRAGVVGWYLLLVSVGGLLAGGLSFTQWVTACGPLLLLATLVALKTLGEMLRSYRVPVVTTVIPALLTMVVVANVLQYAALLERGSTGEETDTTRALPAMALTAYVPTLGSATLAVPPPAPEADPTGDSPPTASPVPAAKASHAVPSLAAVLSPFASQNIPKNHAVLTVGVDAIEQLGPLAMQAHELPKYALTEQLAQWVRPAQWVIENPDSRASRKGWQPLLASYPHLAHLRATDPATGLRLWRVEAQERKAWQLPPSQPKPIMAPTPVPLPALQAPPQSNNQTSAPTPMLQATSPEF